MAVTRYVNCCLFSSALALLWTSIHTLFLPFRLLSLAPEELKNTYLGLANLATAGRAALSRLAGPLIDLLNRYGPALGYFAVLVLCGLYFLGGSLVLFNVKAR